MKKSKILLLTLSSFLLTGCSFSEFTSKITGLFAKKPSSEITDTTTTDTSEDEQTRTIPDIAERYEGLTEKTAGCGEVCVEGAPSSTGFLTEIQSDRFVGENETYECYFESYSADKTIRVVADHRYSEKGVVHATVEMDPVNKSKFVIKTLTAGDFVLKIYNSEDCLVFRKIVRVRPTYSETEILEVLCDAEYYKTIEAYEQYIGAWKCAFYQGNNGVELALSGGDDADRNVKITAALTYSDYYAPTGCYIFNTTVLTSNTRNTSLIYFTVSAQGDLGYLYYPVTNDKGQVEEHLLTFLYNTNISYVYES